MVRPRGIARAARRRSVSWRTGIPPGAQAFSPTMGSLDDDRTEAEWLATRRAAIETKLREIESAAVTAAGGIGFGKRVGEGTNIAVERISEVAIHDGLQAELATVRRAEEKVVDGDAGRCDHCGREIPAERREALPWAVTCVDCAV